MENNKKTNNNEERKIWETVTINLYAIYKYFPELDIIDAVLLYYLRDVCNLKSKSLLRKTKNGKEFTWITHKHIIEQVPSLNFLSKEELKTRFLKLVKLGLFEYFVENGKLFVAPTELSDLLVFTPDTSTQIDTSFTTKQNFNKEEIAKKSNFVICWVCNNPKDRKDCLQSSPESFICKECFAKKRFAVRSKKPVKQEKTLEKALKKEEKLYEIENKPVFDAKEQSEITLETSKEERKEKRKGERKTKNKKDKEELDIWDIPY
jgi:hypothetical protein